MLITNTSAITGVTHTREIHVTDEQYLDWKMAHLYRMPCHT